MTSPLQAYNLYMTTKKHYINKMYSAFHDKPVRIAESRFIVRPERYRIEKLAKRFSNQKELIQYYVANFALGTPDFLYQLDEYGDSSYSRWESYKQSLRYNLTNDIEAIQSHQESSDDDIITSMISLFISNKIKLQSLVIIDAYYEFLTKLVQGDTLNMLYRPFVMRAYKTKGFINFDKAGLTTIVRGLEVEEYE